MKHPKAVWIHNISSSTFGPYFVSHLRSCKTKECKKYVLVEPKKKKKNGSR